MQQQFDQQILGGQQQQFQPKPSLLSPEQQALLSPEELNLLAQLQASANSKTQQPPPPPFQMPMMDPSAQFGGLTGMEAPPMMLDQVCSARTCQV